MLHQRADTAVTLAGVEASRMFFGPCLEGSDEGATWVAYVDAEVRCIHVGKYARTNEEPLPVRDIVRDAAAWGSSGLIIAENAGEDSASAVTKARGARHLADAAELIDVTLLDHLIFDGPSCISMRRAGLL